MAATTDRELELGFGIRAAIYVMTSGPLSGLKLLAGHAVLSYVPGVRPRHGLLLWAVLAWARSSPGWAKNGLWAGPTGSVRWLK